MKGDPSGPGPLARILSGAVAALLLSAAFPPLGLAFMVWVGLLPWLLTLLRPVGRGFLRGFLAYQATYGFIQLAWVSSVTGAPAAGMAGTLILTTLYVAISLPFGLLLRLRMRQPRFWPLLEIPLLFTVHDLVRQLAIGGIAWHSPGFAMARWTWLLQAAEWGRVWPLCWLAYAANTALALAWRRRGDGLRRALVAPALIALAAGFFLVSGALRLRTVEAATRPGPRVALLQPSIRQEEKLDASANAVLVRYRRLLALMAAARAAGEVDLWIWPETSFFEINDRKGGVGGGISSAGAFERGIRFGEELFRVADDFRAAVRPASIERPRFLLGALVREDLDPGEEDLGVGCRESNRALLVELDGDRLRPLGSYDKRALVPFGEYIPFRTSPFGADLSQFVKKTAGYLPAITAGRGGVLLPASADGPRFSPSICFEIIYPDLYEEAAASGADFHVNISNDAWYDESAERELVHLQAVFRAVETRRPLVRVSNTGISAVVDAAGRETAVVESAGERLSRQGYAIGAVPLLDDFRPFRAPRRYGRFLWVLVIAGEILGATIVKYRPGRGLGKFRTP